MNLKKGKVVTVTSNKGGVGKSMTSIILADTYNRLGYTTLIIDMDFYSGAIATIMNSNLDKTIFNLIEDLSNNRYKDIYNYIYNYSDKFSLLASCKDPRNANKIDSKYIPLIINAVIYKYDIIIIDTTHILDTTNIITIDNSDAILYLFTNDPVDIKCTKSFCSIIKDTDISNCYMVLNNAICPDKNYFTNYDIKNIIKRNIDFEIPKNMYIKNIDRYIMDDKTILKYPNIIYKDKRNMTLMENICKTLILDKEALK